MASTSPEPVFVECHVSATQTHAGMPLLNVSTTINPKPLTGDKSAESPAHHGGTEHVDGPRMRALSFPGEIHTPVAH